MSRKKKNYILHSCELVWPEVIPDNWHDREYRRSEFQFDMILAYPMRHAILIIFSLKYCLKNEQKSIIRWGLKTWGEAESFQTR